MRALHALALLCAVHALQLHLPSLQQEHGGHEHLLWHAGLHCGQGPGRPALSLPDAPAGAPRSSTFLTVPCLQTWAGACADPAQGTTKMRSACYAMCITCHSVAAWQDASMTILQ